MRVAAALVFIPSFLMSACSLGTPYVDGYNEKNSSHSLPFVAELNESTATALTTTPTESSASMEGTFYVTSTSFRNVHGIAGQIDMEANFAAGTVSGKMTEFVEVQPTSTSTRLIGKDMFGEINYAGTINIGTGSGDDISATGSGRMRTTNGTTYSTTTTMNGDFYRRPSSALAAAGGITMTGNPGATAETGTGSYFVTE